MQRDGSTYEIKRSIGYCSNESIHALNEGVGTYRHIVYRHLSFFHINLIDYDESKDALTGAI